MCIKTGFLVTNNLFFFNGKKYYGVDTDPWEMDFKECSFYAPNVREEYYLESDMLSNDFVFLLNEKHAKLYYEQYRKIVNDARLLYCICTLEENIHALNSVHTIGEYNFLGYDYAYGGGDYYSAVLNDVVIRPQLFQNRFALNKYGLISNVETMSLFIHERTEAEHLTDDVMLFEKGDFVIYKLYDATPKVSNV